MPAESRPGTSRPQILLVGGSGDGQWVPDRGNATFERIVRSVSYKDFRKMFGGVGEPVSLQTTMERYFREEWCVGGDPHSLPLYRHESLTTASAILRLMVHYKPEK